MTSNLITKLIVIGAVWALTGCESKSSDLGQGKIEYGVRSAQADPLKIDVNANVDILFVIDDSGSMKSHQTKFVQNINEFVKEFAKNSVIDFHIGVTTNWDSIRYGEYDAESNQVVTRTIVPFKDRNGVQQYEEVGHLRPLKAPKGLAEDVALAALKAQPANYIVNGPNFMDILKDALDVGIREFQRASTDKVDAKGPENEEFFSPIAAAIRSPVADGPNKGFLRPGDESFLVVVIVTDATDASSISVGQLNGYLKSVKGKGNYSVFGVLNLNAKASKDCTFDPAMNRPLLKDPVTGLRADSIMELVSITGGKALHMCSNYAKELSEIGALVRDRTLKEIIVPVPAGALLDSNTVVVKYGKDTVPYGQINGWSWNVGSKSIVIRGAANWEAQKDAKISVAFEPVDPSRRSSHIKE